MCLYFITVYYQWNAPTLCLLMLFVGKFQTDVVKNWAKELYSLRSQAYGQHANDAEVEATS